MDMASTLRVRVSARENLTPEIALFTLVSVDGTPLPAYEAGAHIDVHTPSGQTRQYSLCADPHQAGPYQVAVLHDPASRGGSQSMHQAVHSGEVLEISAPRNHFALVPEARRSLLLAGGIGITPLLSMAHTLHAQGQAFDLHYCTRSHTRTAFLDTLRAAPFASQVHFHFDDGAAEQCLNMAALLASPEVGLHLYVCGPQGFIDAALGTARAHGWPEAQLHCEFFKASPQPAQAGDGFEVVLASSGQVIRVAPQQSVVAALRAHGVDVPTSCEQGVCGTCVTRVLQGEPDHRDLYFTPDEQACNDQFLPCCSRAKSARLVLDL